MALPASDTQRANNVMNVLVVEDHPIVLAGCRAVFAQDPQITMREARTAASARTAFDELRPDVVVIDINLPDGSGLELTQEFAAADPPAKIVVFSMSDAPVLALQAIDFGAKAYVSKNGDPDSLRHAVHAVSRGQTWLPEDMIQEIALLRAGSAGVVPSLTEREVQILKLLVRGRSLAEIGTTLDVSYKTVAAVCAGMRAKLNARTTSELVRIAVECKIA